MTATETAPEHEAAPAARTATDPTRSARARATAALVDLRRDALAGGLTAVVLVLLGAPAGLLWAGVAPRVLVVLSADGASLADPESSAFLSADLAFAVLALVLGLLCGTGAWLLARRHGPGAVLGLLAGGLLAALAAKQTGEQVGRDAFDALVHDAAARGTFQAPVRLRAHELLVAWPVGALAAFGALTLVRTGPGQDTASPERDDG